MYLLLQGRMPVTSSLGYQWWETPNIHFCTLADFHDLCRSVGVVIERSVILNDRGQPVSGTSGGWRGNLLGEQGVFLLRRR